MAGVDEKAQALKILNNQRLEAAAIAVEMADVSLIFAFKQFLLEMLEGLGHTILFPIAAGASVIRAILKIREAYLAKKENKQGAILRAVVETLAAVAISTVVIGTFLAAATFAVVGPIIFTATLALKTFFHLSSAIYYWLSAAFADDDKQKQAYNKKALSNLALTAITGLTTVACGLVLVAHKLSFGIMGIIGGALGAVYAIYKGVTATTSTPASKSPTPRAQLNSAPVAVPASQNQLRLANTAAIQASVRLSVRRWSPEMKEEDQGLTASEQKAYEQLSKELNQLKESIGNSMRTLERKVGAHHAFSTRGDDEAHFFAPINTYWWGVLYQDKYDQQPERYRALMRQIDASIKQYNGLLQNQRNAALLEKERNQANREAAAKRSQDDEREAAEAKEFHDRTGWTKEDALSIAHMAGLGAQYSP